MPIDLLVRGLHTDADEIGLTESSIEMAAWNWLRGAHILESGGDSPYLHTNMNAPRIAFDTYQ